MTDYANIIDRDAIVLSGSADHKFPQDELILEIDFRADAPAVSLFERTAWTASDGVPGAVYRGDISWITLASGPAVVDMEQLRKQLSEGGALAHFIDREIERRNQPRAQGLEAFDFPEDLDWQTRESLIDDRFAFWSTIDWCQDEAAHVISAQTTDETLAELAEGWEDHARGEKVILDAPVLEFLRDFRDELRAEA